MHLSRLCEPITYECVLRSWHRVEFEDECLFVKFVEAACSSRALSFHNLHWRAPCCACSQKKDYVKCVTSRASDANELVVELCPTLSFTKRACAGKMHHSLLCWANKGQFVSLKLKAGAKARAAKTFSPRIVGSKDALLHCCLLKKTGELRMSHRYTSFHLSSTRDSSEIVESNVLSHK